MKQGCIFMGKVFRRVTRRKAEFRNTNTLLSGWLWKQGELNTLFKRRYCILNELELQYCKTETSTDPQGIIPIDSMLQVKSGWIAGLKEMNGRATDFGFVITTEVVLSGRTYYFVAESEEQKYMWIQLLSEEIMKNTEIRDDDDADF